MSIENDIKSDIIKRIEEFFSDYDLKYKLNEYKNINEYYQCRIIELLNILEKWIYPKPRNVHYSYELKKKMNNALNKEICSLISLFEYKFTKGDNINTHQSKGIFRSSQYDFLLNIFNIRHIHLSDKEATNYKNMSKNRSNNLLFYVVNDTDVYFFDVLPHPQGAEFIRACLKSSNKHRNKSQNSHL